MNRIKVLYNQNWLFQN